MIKLIAGLFSGVTAMIAAIFAMYARKFTVVTAGILTLLSLLALFVICINSIVASVVGAISVAEGSVGSWLLVWVGAFVPANFATVLGLIVSGKICRAAYDLGRKKTELVVYGN